MASFDLAIPWILGHEGGFQRSPGDRGNYYQGELQGTKYGISAPVARANGWLARMEDLTLDFAESVYESSYWPGLDGVNSQAIATKILDMRVQFGVAGADAMVQRALQGLGWPIAVDGMIGPITRDCLNRAKPGIVLEALVVAMEGAYRKSVTATPGNVTFLDGWLNRARMLPVVAAAGALTGLLLVGVVVWFAVRA